MPIIVGSSLPETPPSDPPAQPQPDSGPVLRWTGWNGDSWVLCGDHLSRARLEADGVTGLLEPPAENFLTESAVHDGSVWQAARAGTREVQLPVFLWGNSGGELRVEDAKFRATLRRGKVGKLTVQEPDGSKRFLDLRYSAGAEGDLSVNMYGLEWIRHPLKLVAPDVFYYGDTVTIPFIHTTGTNFYGAGAGLGPPFHITSSHSITNAQVTNPGDVDAWPTWKVHGPFTSFVGGWDGKVITVTVTKTLGQWIEIVTHPKVGTIKDDTGANMWPNASAATEFAPLPASTTTALGLTVAGAGSGTKVDFTFTPRYEAAW